MPMLLMMMPITTLYRVPNVRYEAQCVYTNNTYSQAMRGYGNPQATFAIESTIDMLAAAAGIDPLEFRHRSTKPCSNRRQSIACPDNIGIRLGRVAGTCGGRRL